VGASEVVRRSASTSSVGTSPAAFVTDGTFDVVLPVTAGDVIEVGVSAVWGMTSANYGFGDVAVMVSGSPARWVSSGTSTAVDWGLPGCMKPSTISDNMPMAATAYYTVQSGDIVSGNITLRLYGFTSAGTSDLALSSNNPGQLWASVCDDDPVTAALTGTPSSSWGLMTGSCTVTASAGDVLAITLNAYVQPNGAVNAYFDAVTTVSGTQTNWASTGTSSRATQGVSAWREDVFDWPGPSGTVLYTVQSGDVVSGQVTVRIDAATSSSTRTIRATGSSFSVRKVA
jgi:hypothetical protein